MSTAMEYFNYLFRAIFLSLYFLAATAWSQVLKVDRVEPPNWWVGMREPVLELMLHGEGIAQAQPHVRYPGVKVLHTYRSDNPNYLWLQLQLGKQVHPGQLRITLSRGQQTTALLYWLNRREQGSANRLGFSSADVVLNVMPDRFANGDIANDNQSGFDDFTDRSALQGRHGGDIAGIHKHLDYVAGMGFTALWITPMVENKQPIQSYHGYASTDNYRIDPRYGTNEDYRKMVKAAHEMGLKVIQDIVPNHIGDHHWWLQDLPSNDWLSNHNTYAPTNHARTTVSDRYAANVDRRAYLEGWFVPTMPDMNASNPRVARYLLQNALWWIEYAGVSGLRVDTYGYSNTAFIKEWTRGIRKEFPRLGIVGEEWTENPVVQSYWVSKSTLPKKLPYQLPSVMDFVLQAQLLRALMEPESWNTGFMRLYETLVNDQLVAYPQNLMLFDGNHDMPRLFSVFNEDPALTRMALAYILTIKRTPQLYYGSEILMTSSKKHDDFDAFRADFPGGWPDDRVNAFTGEGLTVPQREHQQWVRKLLNWRKTQAVIHHGDLMHFAPENGTYVMVRYDHKSRVMIIFNKNISSTPIKLARFAEIWPPGARVTNVISGDQLVLGSEFDAPAKSVTILQTYAP